MWFTSQVKAGVHWTELSAADKLTEYRGYGDLKKLVKASLFKTEYFLKSVNQYLMLSNSKRF